MWSCFLEISWAAAAEPNPETSPFFAEAWIAPAEAAIDNNTTFTGGRG